MPRPGRISPLVSAVIAALAVGAGTGAVLFSTFSSPDTKTVVQQIPVGSSETTASTSALTVGEIYRRSFKSVVEITVASNAPPGIEGEGQQAQAQGSGFVYDTDGHVVTNEHVVEGADTLSVRFWNGDTYTATVVGTDPSTDLAVIDVDAPQSILHPVTLGDSSAVRVGDGVVAIGSPFGLEETATSGIVSALHRQMRAPNDFTINDSIQTDAAINHGNSGGPLLNARGQVIGVNAQIRSESGGSDGVGFAIPSNTVRTIADGLISNGKIEHAFLGVRVQTIPESVAAKLNLVAGAEIDKVTSSTPAAKAKLHPATGTKVVENDTYSTGGDVITAIDGQKITTSEELQRAIDAKKPSDTVKVEYWRNGDTHTVEVELATRPAQG
jgi:putative serine protease PepD